MKTEYRKHFAAVLAGMAGGLVICSFLFARFPNSPQLATKLTYAGSLVLIVSILIRPGKADSAPNP